MQGRKMLKLAQRKNNSLFQNKNNNLEDIKKRILSCDEPK